MERFIVRGILIGGAIGLMASWFGYPAMFSLGLGMIAGFLAGVTRYCMERRRAERDRDQ